MQKLRISSFRQDSLFTRIIRPLSNLRHIETNCDPQIIGEILRSISQAVEGDLLPVLETITMFLTSQKLPNTTQDIQSYLDKLKSSADKIISKEFHYLRHMLLKHNPPNESQVSALVHCADQPKDQMASLVEKSLGPTVQGRLSFSFPKLHADSMGALSSSIYASIAQQLQLEKASGVGSLPESTSAQLIEAKFHQSLFQALIDVTRDPTVSRHLAVSMFYRVRCRISAGIKYSKDRNLCDSVAAEFVNKLVEILPEVLKDSEQDLKLKEIMKVTLCPFFASQYAEQAGVPFTEELVSLFNAEATGSYVDVQAVEQIEASFWSSAVKWKLRQRGIRIYFSQQSDV